MMKTKSRSDRKVQLAFASAIVILLVVGALSYRTRVISVESDRWVRHTHEVIETLQDLSLGMKAIDSSTRGYVITRTVTYLDSYHAGVAQARQAEAAFRTLTADNLNQQGLIPTLEALMARKILRAETVIGLRETRSLEATADAVRGGPGQLITDQFEGVVRAARDEELRLLAMRDADSDWQSRLTSGLVIFGTVFGALIAAAAGWSVQRDNARWRLAAEWLHESEERFRTMANNISQLAWMADSKGSIFWYNQRWFEYTGTTLEEMADGHGGKQKVQHPDHGLRVTAEAKRCFESGEIWEDTFPLRRADGLYRWFLSRAVPIRDSSGKVRLWFGTNTDISEIKLLEETLFEERERAQVTLKSIGDAVACTDILGNISFINAVAEKMTGWSSHEATGQPMADVLRIVDAATRKTVLNPMEIASSQNRSVSLPPNCLLVRRDGLETPIEDSAAPIHDREGQVAGAVIVFRDVSAARAMALKMAHLAQHDFLTGLPNRMLLHDRIGQAIALAARHKKNVAVLFIDLDGFKKINDSLGHAMGDRLLQSVANRLSGCVRASDTVSRQGGDEFVALLSEMERPEDAAILATRMLRAVADTHLIDGDDLRVTASIGISVYPEDGIDAATLIKQADIAMYGAKEDGRQNFKFFQPAMNLLSSEAAA